MSDRCRVVIVDDHAAFRRELRRIVESEPDFEVLGEAVDGQQGLELIRRTSPAVVVLDVSMPPPDGLAVARSLREEHLSPGIILLTMYREGSIFTSASELGLSYVLKDSAISDIVAAIQSTWRGERYVSPLLRSYIEDRARPGIPPVMGREYEQAFRDLFPSERRVLELLAEYKTTREIADKLGITPAQVEILRLELCRKLGLPGSHTLMKFALKLKAAASAGSE